MKSLDGRVFEFDEKALEQYRIPDEQVRALVGNYALPPAPEARPTPPQPSPAPAGAAPGISLQVPEALKDFVSVEQRPGNRIVIHLGPGARHGSPKT